MAEEPVNTSIQSKYAEQLAADLAANQAEQATLTVRLGRLQEEEKWLAATLESLPAAAGGEPAAAAEPVDGTVAADAGAEAAAVPQPRAEKTPGASSVKKAPAKKTTRAKRAAKKAPVAKKAPAGKAPAVEGAVVAKKAVAGKAPTAKKTGVKKATTAKQTVKPTAPTLGELLKELLARQPGEPKKVSEISAELKADHPERATSDQVVRNTLERLVAKDELEKDTRQGLTLYTWPTAHAPASTTAAVAEQPKEEEPTEAALTGI
ncbi:hypothetical protein [Streptomyces sp. TLI_105]|uniref:hypothetical protein n=1 Tax=Streptomyces sp. TLI_105 TaxID=1881019 RepID=UPI000898F55E|nr:hypothetical protein [Streptomyces sp. TLI_105]SEE23019.1 hypothetical protein SAMN05428939_7803 [Streptomyces sp. TLI_105]